MGKRGITHLSSHSVRLATKYSLDPGGRKRLRLIRSKTDFRLGHSLSIRAAVNTRIQIINIKLKRGNYHSMCEDGNINRNLQLRQTSL